MLVSKSEDGGAHWTEPVTLIDDPNPHVFNDKNSLTADPNDSDLVYAVWDRLVFPNRRSQGESSALVAAAFKGPIYFSRTENGTDDDGGDWTTRKILDLGENDQTIGNVIAVLPRTAGQTESTLIDVFDWIHNDNKGGRKGEKISAIWSTDSGDTWSNPVVIDPIANAVVRDRDADGAPCPETLGTSSIPTSAACEPVTGRPTSPSTWPPARCTRSGRTARRARWSRGWPSRATTGRAGPSSGSSTAFRRPTRTRRRWRLRPTARWR